MRPRDMKLRKRYFDAAAAILGKEETLTQKILAQELKIPWKAVRKYLRRYPEMLSALGIKTRKICTVQDYLKAVEALVPEASKKRWKVIRVKRFASNLGVEKSTASRFLWTHPEILAAIPEGLRTSKRRSPVRSTAKNDDVLMRASGPIQPVESTQERPRFKKGQEIGVNYRHETSGRMTFASVTFQEYVQLWDREALQFQIEGLPRPEHLPTREEALALI